MVAVKVAAACLIAAALSACAEKPMPNLGSAQSPAFRFDANSAPHLTAAPTEEVPAPHSTDRCSVPSSGAELGRAFPGVRAVATADVVGPGEVITAIDRFTWYRFTLANPEILASDIKGLTVESIQVASSESGPRIKPGRYLLMLLQADPAPDGTIDADLVPAQGLVGVMPVMDGSVTVMCPDGQGQMKGIATVPLKAISEWAAEAVSVNRRG